MITDVITWIVVGGAAHIAHAYRGTRKVGAAVRCDARRVVTDWLWPDDRRRGGR